MNLKEGIKTDKQIIPYIYIGFNRAILNIFSRYKFRTKNMLSLWVLGQRIEWTKVRIKEKHMNSVIYSNVIK